MYGHFRVFRLDFLQVSEEPAAVLNHFHHALGLIGGIIVHAVEGKIVAVFHIRTDFDKIFLVGRRRDIFRSVHGVHLFVPGLAEKLHRLCDA